MSLELGHDDLEVLELDFDEAPRHLPVLTVDNSAAGEVEMLADVDDAHEQ